VPGLVRIEDEAVTKLEHPCLVKNAEQYHTLCLDAGKQQGIEPACVVVVVMRANTGDERGAVVPFMFLVESFMTGSGQLIALGEHIVHLFCRCNKSNDVHLSSPVALGFESCLVEQLLYLRGIHRQDCCRCGYQQTCDEKKQQ
jgi:hypothetical protein